jgi:NAD-dependent dihydropyrimidine dehydrogenase PreA subunit/flavodoxin
MIFYFSATGNSKYAAEKIAEATGDRVQSIGEALRGGRYEYDIAADERLGFVVPVFAATLPGAVGLFIEKLALKGYSDQFVYAVFTCGESSGFESAALYTMLDAKSIGFNGSFDLVMPDNFIIWSDVPPQDRLEAILSESDRQLTRIITAIQSKTNGKIDRATPSMLYFALQEISSSKGTSKLSADDHCTSCGLCVEICPMGVIGMDGNNRPVWEGSCALCLACLHRCPARAVQHGNDTQNKGRYVNPYVTM